MTPAIRLLKQQKIDFEIHQYKHNPSVDNFGLEAADKLGFPTNQIFKTLIIAVNGDNKNLIVAVIPVVSILNLKELAVVLKVKKVELADKDSAQKSSGYLIGGISPIGQKKLLPTYIDETALNFSIIYISGGKRGLDIEIDPKTLALVTKAEFIKVAVFK